MAKRVLEVVLLGDETALRKALGRATRDVDKFGRAADGHGKLAAAGFRAAGIAAKAGAGAVAGIGVASLKAAGDYEQSLNIFQAVSGATKQEMAKVGSVAKRLGADVHLPATSAKDAAEAMTELAKGGLSAKESMAAARGVLQLSAAAQIDNAQAATIAVRALNAFSLKGRDANRVADQLAATANASSAEITDVAMGFQQAAASAAQMGVPIEHLNALLGIMANKGIVGSDAGTSLKTMFAKLVPQTNKAADAMAELGVDVFDSHGKFIGVRGAIKQYHDALIKLNPEQRTAAINTIFGSDAQRAANIVLLGGVKQFDAMEKAVTRQGAAQELAAAKTKGFKGSMEAFKSVIETLAIDFGTVLLPAATDAMRGVTNFVSGLQDGTGAGGKFRDVIVEVWNTVQGVTSTAVGAIKDFLKGNREDIDSTADAFSNLAKVIAWVWEKVALPIIQRVLPAIKQIVEGNLKIIGGIVKVFAGILTGDFGKAWEGVKQIFSGAARAVLGTLRALTAPFREAASQLGHALVNGFKAVGEALAGAGEWAVRKIAAAIRATADAAGDAGRFILDKVRDGFKGAGEFVKDAADWLLAKLTGFIHGVGSGFKDVGSFIVDKIGDGLRGGLNAIIGFVNKIISVINKIPGVDIKPIAKASAEEMGGEDLVGGALGKGAGLPLSDHRDGKGGLPGKVLSSLSPSSLIGKLPSPDLPPMMGNLGGYLIDKVKDFIGDKLKDVLSIGKGSLSPGSLDKITSLAGRFGLTMTSAFRPGDDGLHGQNRARDYSDGYATPKELAFARLMAGAYGGKLLELIHTPLGFGIKNGQRVPLSFWGPAVNADHYDHVHVAMAKGGTVKGLGQRVLVGERGPEIVDLPGGSRVFSNQQSKRMGWGGDINLAPGGVVKIGSQVDLRREMNRVAFRMATG